MNMPSDVALVFLPLVLPICALVIWTDLRWMRIRNVAVDTLALIFVLVGPFLMTWEDWGWGLARMVIVLAIGYVLTMRGSIGGGDAKFIAAAAAYIWPGDGAVISTILLAALPAAFATHRLARATPLRLLAPHWRSWHRFKFPMGLVLGGALPAYLMLAVWHGQ